MRANTKPVNNRLYPSVWRLEPAFAALVGFFILKEKTGLRALFALILIVIASGGVSLFQQKTPHEKID